MASYRDLVVRFAGDAGALKTSTRQVQSQLTTTADTAEKQGKRGGKRFGAGIAAGVAGAAKRVAGPLAAIFAAGQVVTFGKDAVKAASDMNETLNQSSVIFGKQARGMKIWAQTAATSFGLSKQEALNAATGFGDMFLQLGFTGREASKSSKNIVKMASDLGSFKNLETSDVLERISAAMRGEYDSLQAVIPNINAARVQKEALAATGKKNASALTAEEKAQATMNIIMKDGARARGDFARTSGGLANQQKILSAQWSDLQAKLGNLLLPIVTTFFGFLNKVAVPALSRLTSGLSGGNKTMGKAAGIFATVRDALAPVVDGFRRFGAAVRPIVTQLGAELFPIIRENMPAISGAAKDLGSILRSAFLLIGKYYSTLAAVISRVWKIIGPTVTKIFGNTFRAIIRILSGAIKIIAGVLNVLVGIFTGDFSKIRKGAKQIFSGLVKIVGALVRLMVANFKAILGPLAKWAAGRFLALGRAIRNALLRLGKWVTGTWRKLWMKLADVIGEPVLAGYRKAKRAVGRVRDALSGVRKWAGSTWRKGWSGIKGWIGDAVDDGRGRADRALDRTRAALNGLRSWGKSTWRKGWAQAKEWIADPIGKGRDLVRGHQDRIRGALRGLDSWGSKTFGPRWDRMKDRLANPLRWAQNTFRSLLGRGGPIRSIFAGAVDAIGRIWDRIRGKLSAPIRFLVNTVINKGIRRAVNTVANFVGADPLPKVSLPKGMRTGGPVRGPGGPTADRVPILGSNGEHMWTAREVARAGGHGAVKALRSAAAGGRLMVQRLALGGPVRPVNGPVTNRHSRAEYPWASFAGDYAMPMGSPVRAVSDGVIALVRHLTTSYGNHIRLNHEGGGSSLYAHLSETIARIGQQVSAGQLIGRVGSTGNSTGPHLHLELLGRVATAAKNAVSGVAGAVGRVIPNIGKLVTGAVSKAMAGYQKFAGSPWGQIVEKLPPKLASMAIDWGKDKLSALNPLSGAGKNFGADRMGIAKTIATTAHRLGFGKRGAIIGLITGMVESGLRNVNYGDRDSLGVFQQRAPWGPASARLNPAKAAQMFYLGGQGGQPGLRDKPWRNMGMGEAAQAVQVSAFPGRYAQEIPDARRILAKLGGNILNRDSGGPIPTGLSLIQNSTGREEQAVTGSQWDAITSGDSKIEINVNVQGGIVDDRTADQIAAALERRLRRKGPTRISARTRS